MRRAVGNRARLGSHDLGEMGQHRGVERVGFGELAGCAAEVANLAWIDDRDGDLCHDQRRDDRRLQPTCRLEHDERRVRCAINCAMPASSLPRRIRSEVGRMNTSKYALETSTPMNIACLRSQLNTLRPSLA